MQSSGYLLPNSAANREHFEWLAAEIRSYKGSASIAEVESFDEQSSDDIGERFQRARSRDYQALMRELKKVSSTKTPSQQAMVQRLRHRFSETVAIDFFGAQERDQVERMFQQLEQQKKTKQREKEKLEPKDFIGRVWLTRPHPGIDRVSSAWLIRRFIDAKAKFVFGSTNDAPKTAIPFDMYVADGFGHDGDNCTFETLVQRFGIRDKRVRLMAEAIHDADIADQKFGRTEAIGLDRVFVGWATQGLGDEAILERGMDLIEGLYNAI